MFASFLGIQPENSSLYACHVSTFVPRRFIKTKLCVGFVFVTSGRVRVGLRVIRPGSADCANPNTYRFRKLRNLSFLRRGGEAGTFAILLLIWNGVINGWLWWWFEVWLKGCTMQWRRWWFFWSGCEDCKADVDERGKDSKELSLIREQLAMIENQQSSLLDLLQVIP